MCYLQLLLVFIIFNVDDIDYNQAFWKVVQSRCALHNYSIQDFMQVHNGVENIYDFVYEICK